MFAEQERSPGFPGQLISALLLAIVLTLLLAQPDFGMAVVVAAVWFSQFFMAGVAMAWIGGLAFLGL
ncbi:MAG: cell division protein FtsW, partial [Rhodospirillaceae bacterium]|nr:cell division protein FtsW [Rhodospirillaceae bacterium]